MLSVRISLFTLQVIEHLSVPHMEASETDPHVVRVGWSLDTTSLQLGTNFCLIENIYSTDNYTIRIQFKFCFGDIFHWIDSNTDDVSMISF